MLGCGIEKYGEPLRPCWLPLCRTGDVLGWLVRTFDNPGEIVFADGHCVVLGRAQVSDSDEGNNEPDPVKVSVVSELFVSTNTSGISQRFRLEQYFCSLR